MPRSSPAITLGSTLSQRIASDVKAKGVKVVNGNPDRIERAIRMACASRGYTLLPGGNLHTNIWGHLGIDRKED